MLSASAFKNLSQAEAYKQYTSLYEKVEEKTKIIENYITKLDAKLDSLQIPSQRENIIEKTNEKTVRSFKPFAFSDDCQNLILGSSIVRKLRDDSLPMDVTIHAYSGSTTREKIEVVDKYSERQLRSIILQDGTNSVLKNPDIPVCELFKDYETLVEKVSKKFNPEFLALVEVPPLRKSERNQSANERIKEFNEQIHNFAAKFNSDEVFPLNLHQSMSMLPNYDMLLFDDIHLNYQYGLPFLKSMLIPILMKTSNGKTAPARPNRFFNSRANFYKPNHYSQQNYNNQCPQQTYNYQRPQQTFTYQYPQQTYNYMSKY